MRTSWPASTTDRQRDCKPENHRTAFDRNVLAAMFPEGKAQRRERNRRRGAKQSREALGTQQVAYHRKEGNDHTPIKKRSA